MAEWKAIKEVESEEEIEEHDGDNLEEVVVEADEGDMLTLDAYHPPKGKEHHNLLFISFGEPPNLSPSPPTPKTLKQNFCQFISEPLLKAHNSELRAYEEVVRSCLLYTSPSPRDGLLSRMPSSA